MIETKKDLNEYLICDKKQLGITRRFPRPFTDEIWKFEIALRKYEYWYNQKSAWAKVIRPFYKLRWHRWGRMRQQLETMFSWLRAVRLWER